MKKGSYLILFLSCSGIIDLNFAMLMEEKCNSEEEILSEELNSEESECELLDNATDYLKAEVEANAKRIEKLIYNKINENKQMGNVLMGLNYLNDFFSSEITSKEAKKEKLEKLLESKEIERMRLEQVLNSKIGQSVHNNYRIRLVNLQQKINEHHTSLVNLQKKIYNKCSNAQKHTSELIALLKERQTFYVDKVQYEKFCNIMNNMALFMKGNISVIIAQIWYILNKSTRSRHQGLTEVRNVFPLLWRRFSNETRRITAQKNTIIHIAQSPQLNASIPANYLENFKQTFFYRAYKLHHNALQILKFLRINEKFYTNKTKCDEFCRLLNSTIQTYNPSDKKIFSPQEKFRFYYPHSCAAQVKAKKIKEDKVDYSTRLKM